MKLTKKQKKGYLEHCGNFCPFCLSEDIDGGHFEADYNQAWRDVTCNKCGKVWQDIYTLTDVEAKE